MLLFWKCLTVKSHEIANSFEISVINELTMFLPCSFQLWRQRGYKNSKSTPEKKEVVYNTQWIPHPPQKILRRNITKLVRRVFFNNTLIRNVRAIWKREEIIWLFNRFSSPRIGSTKKPGSLHHKYLSVRQWWKYLCITMISSCPYTFVKRILFCTSSATGLLLLKKGQGKSSLRVGERIETQTWKYWENLH